MFIDQIVELLFILEFLNLDVQQPYVNLSKGERTRWKERRKEENGLY